MSEKAKVKETVRLYSKVWQLPTFAGIILRILLVTIVASLLLAVSKSMIISLDVFFEAFTFYTVLFLVTAFIGSGILYGIIRKPGSPLDLRRTFGSVQFGILFWFILGVIGGYLDLIFSSTFYEIRFWIFGMGIAYMFFSFLVTGLSDYSPMRNFVGALMIPVVWIVSIQVLSIFSQTLPILPLFWFLTIPAILVFYSMAVHYIFASVSKPFERDLDINGPELLRAFGYDYLTNNSEPLETTLKYIGRTQDVPIEIMIFKNSTGLVAVGVVLYVHPGPFRDIGSSGLPSAIIKHIKDTHGVQGFVFHGTCTHHQNLTTKEDYGKVFSEIDRLIENTEVHSTMSELQWTDQGKFKVWSMFVGDDVLTISTSAPDFTDDIALDVGISTARAIKSKHPDIKNVAIVDAHNCIDDDAVSVMPEDVEAGIFTSALVKAIGLTKSNPRHPVMMGIHQVIPENITAKEGIAIGGVIAVVLKVGSAESAIILVDGNNMQPGFREEVFESLKKEGIDKAEVVTTDTHLVNAISLSSKGYPPVGKNNPEETKDAICEAFTKARESMQEVSVGLGFGEVKDLLTFGEKGFDTLTQNIAEAASIAKHSGIRAGGSVFLLSTLLSFLF
ncbi:MAG: DUF2070 family protein [Candidatus Thorarchaeota archaeon]